MWKMKKWLSYCKIQCFVRVAMLKNTRFAVNKMYRFVFDFSSFFRGKSMQNRANCVKTVFVHKNWRTFMFGTTLFSKISIFDGFLGSRWVARGIPGRPENVRKSVIFLIYGQLRLKTGPDGFLVGPRESPGVPRAPTGYHVNSIFVSILHGEKHGKTAKTWETC